MASRVVIAFRDGTKREWPDPKLRVIKSREYIIRYGEGIVTLIDPYNAHTTWPLDIITSIVEESYAG